MPPPKTRFSAIDRRDESLTAAATRFAADCAGPWPTLGKVGLAVSGGPDSVALLVLAGAAFPGRFEVATVDHGLRPESAAEAVAVASLCADRGIAHARLPVTLSPGPNLQARARAARYASLGRWAVARGIGVVATAHHLDDQAETLLMRLARGAGVRGLSGMRAASPMPGAADVLLLRPLLGWRKAELVEVVAGAGLGTVDDPSNRDPRHARAAVRAWLADARWLDPCSVAAAAAHCGDADEAIAWAAQAEWSDRVEAEGAGLAYSPRAPRAVRLRVLERIVGELGHEGAPRGNEIARWLAALEARRTATLGGVRGDGGASPWSFVRAPRRRG